MDVPLSWYLIVAAALFCIGLYGALSRRNAIAVLMGVELMLNAVNVNLIAFWRHVEVAPPTPGLSGQVFAIIVITVAAAEAAVGLALAISVFRNRRSVAVEDVDTLKL